MKKKIRYFLIFLAVASLVGSFIVGSHGESHGLKLAMREAVLHEVDKINLFGLINVNPSVISALIVTGIIFIFSLIVRIFIIPRFKRVPGRFQLILEEVVMTFKNLAISNSPHKYKILSRYIFAAGVYIFIGTLFELSGVQVVSIQGNPITLPAPLSDLNAAIAMGCLSYLFIMSGGLTSNGFKGVLKTLKDFSLPISMSFRLFGALVSGLLVMDLVYHSIFLSFGLPVVVAVLFTLLHAIIQAYVLTLLTSIYYGEVSEIHGTH